MDINSITGLLLAGGMGRRMGGRDKGLLDLDGQTMASRVIERLLPQVGRLPINANRNFDTWRAYGLPVVSDEIGGFSGPLAGMHAGLRACSTPWLLTVPCDSPFLPLDLVSRLATGGEAETTKLAVASCNGRLQQVFVLLHRELLPALETYRNKGGRKIENWLESRERTVMDFDDSAAFVNINTPAELTVPRPH